MGDLRAASEIIDALAAKSGKVAIVTYHLNSL